MYTMQELENQLASNKWTHRIYGRRKGANRYLALTPTGKFTKRLIYAAMFTENKALDCLKEIEPENPDFEFVIRKI